ncbi:DUF2789 family protein [uncultured Endozoicomonas sp.]|uniref:DUF2789 family protein n=1 Tax=uncultured Endozoicomonas sp. TaxID=432652 RepID=UPI002634B62E|nr:DUF2789 family protein [uncultured Endozoicomonas sp.]
MKNTHVNLQDLFSQLGLNSETDQIQQFINEHHLSSDIKLEEAPFWNEAQRQLLLEGRNDDAEWSESIDELDALLRH